MAPRRKPVRIATFNVENLFDRAHGTATAIA